MTLIFESDGEFLERYILKVLHIALEDTVDHVHQSRLSQTVRRMYEREVRIERQIIIELVEQPSNGYGPYLHRNPNYLSLLNDEDDDVRCRTYDTDFDTPWDQYL